MDERQALEGCYQHQHRTDRQGRTPWHELSQRATQFRIGGRRNRTTHPCPIPAAGPGGYGLTRKHEFMLAPLSQGD
ncbi:hypothetical protein AA3990_2371 [Gluconobacter roseus NBRC 3990]|nr:hypothetical protein AA3990_2371 [Gluconobacter roseus NBRC 3990]